MQVNLSSLLSFPLNIKGNIPAKNKGLASIQKEERIREQGLNYGGSYYPLIALN